MIVSSSRAKNVLYQNIEEKASTTNEKFFNFLFISFIASFAIISLEINGHSLSFYRWDWIQIPFGLHVFFTSLAILWIICKSQTSNQSKADVTASQIVPSIPDPSEIALPLSKDMNERNFVEQDLNTYSSTIHKVTTEFMGPLIIKRLPKSSKTFYITQIKEFAIAEKERSSPYLVSFKPQSSSPFQEGGGLVLEEQEWLKRWLKVINYNNYLLFHRKYEYQILQSHISVFVTFTKYVLPLFEITMSPSPSTILIRDGQAFTDHRFGPPKVYTLIDAVTREVKTIHIGFKTISDAQLYCITEISASDKIEEIIDVGGIGHNFFPITKVPLSLEEAQEKLKTFALEYPNFSPQYVAFEPHLSIIACFNLNSSHYCNPEFYIAKPNHGFEKKFVRFGYDSYGLSSTREANYYDTVVDLKPHDILIDNLTATQITNYPEIVTTAFRQLRERINVIESITIDALKDLIFLYLNPASESH